MEQARTLTLPDPAPEQSTIPERDGPVVTGPRGQSAATRKHRRRLSRLTFRLLELALAFVFLAVVVHHVFTFDFKPLAALCIPILAVFFAFSSLLYIRGRSLVKSRGLMRSLYAAEHSMQAAIWHLFGIIVGTSLYGVLTRFGLFVNPSETSLGSLWLLLFLVPYAFMQIGLLCFMRAIWAIAPHFFHTLRAFELRRRVQQ